MAIDEALSRYRSEGKLEDDWNRVIEEDFKKRA